jgi:hypothetical protein
MSAPAMIVREIAECASPARERDWVAEAAPRIKADFARSAGAHLVNLELPPLAEAGAAAR